MSGFGIKTGATLIGAAPVESVLSYEKITLRLLCVRLLHRCLREALGSVGSFHSLANLYTGDGVNVNFGIVVDDDTACNACGEAAAGQFDEGIAGFGSFNVVDVTAVTGDVTVGAGGRLDVDYTAVAEDTLAEYVKPSSISRTVPVITSPSLWLTSNT